MLRTIGALASVSVLMIGCGPGSFDGDVAGVELDVEDSMFLASRNDQGVIKEVLLVMSDFPDVCQDFGNNRMRQDSTLLFVGLRRIVGDDAIQPDEGAYSVSPTSPGVPGRYAFSQLIKLDGACNNVLDDDYGEATSGTVDVDKIEFGDDGRLRGSFDLSFGLQGDDATGSFNATFCDAVMPRGDAICAW